MKTRLSIAFGAIAIAAVAFVALRPTQAYADFGMLKAALKRAKNMHAVATVRDGKQLLEKEIWVSSDALRLDVQGKPAKIVKGDKTFVFTTAKPGQTVPDGEWVVTGVPLKEKHGAFEYTVELTLVDGGGEWVLDKSGAEVQLEFIAVPDHKVHFEVVGTEEIDGRQAEKAILHKPGDIYRTVMWLDPITKLPIVAERQKKNGKTWDVVSQVKFDFTKPIPPSLFEPKAG